ncbi:mycothiol system anti-sigma-R factor [Nocardioides sp. Y6]|uniref:Mycothiol system anti-sigma-R factor n=1 Tax=Nocardioides malaquae TaxID=2773426 RepID=A0ABR9RPV1_9ACTN|nr:mycothiol system anti-sigma-R factor [Nocardioides malaquae]MBE7323591.1 mycothiol system anti-sigma-R factor [Nocardioides malaquae]
MSDPHGDECADYLERIVYFIDNELDGADCSAVQQHLDECGPCLQKYDLQRTVKSVVARSCRESAPEGLRERVMVQIREVQIRISES